VIRFATAAVVCAVAAFAAVVSYSHIYGLGRVHGQDGAAARLLPLSVDGLILAASARERSGLFIVMALASACGVAGRPGGRLAVWFCIPCQPAHAGDGGR
jgi:hypothetical protein